MSRTHIAAILIVAAAVWAVGLAVSGVELTAEFARPFSLATGAVVLVVALFDLWLWRLPLLKGWFVQRPVVRGTWAIRLTSNWTGESQNPALDSIEAYLIIRQTYFMISLRLVTEESSSRMLGTELVRMPDGVYTVAGVYLNESRVAVRERSPIHYGGLILHVRGDPADGLDGGYWTDRLTRGEIHSTAYSRTVCHSFVEARRIVGAAAKVGA